MKVIKFELKGFLNSFRIAFFRTYHKSFLAPPKSTVIGMLCNISLKSQKEFCEILNKELISVSIVIDEIKGKSKDFWSYRVFGGKNRGKSIIRRDKLFKPKYTIYLKIDDKELFNKILQSLKNPKNTPSLGLDDELVEIKNVEVLNLDLNNANRINSIFLDKGIKYKTHIKDELLEVNFPTTNLTPTKFKYFENEKRVPREVIEEFKQIEFLNCEIEFLEEIESFKDEKNRLVFY